MGGKSPCLIDSEVDLATSMKRIAWGKYFNAGQTCVAPDYLLVPRPMILQVVEGLTKAIRGFYGEDPQKSPDYGRIVNAHHFDRLAGLLAEGKIALGGKTDRDTLYISPTLITDAAPAGRLLEDEIFGPLLPILAYDRFEDALEYIKRSAPPLALYLFSKNTRRQREVVERVSFGGGCVNDTLLHLSNPGLPFGGVGESGVGAYHGRHSFETFSHKKSVLYRASWFDPRFRYPPYGNRLALFRRLFG